MPKYRARSRGPNTKKGEYGQGEPQLFYEGLKFHRLGKAAAIPAANLECCVDRGRQIKAAKGFTVANVAWLKIDVEDMIEWRPPPEKVKCMPT